MTRKRDLQRHLKVLPPLNPATDDGFETARPEVPRDRWGRPVLLTADGTMRGHTRVTTYIDVVEDRSALELWKIRTALLGAVESPVIAREASKANSRRLSGTLSEGEWKKRMNSLAREALDAGGQNVLSQTGTDLHALTEVVDRGNPFPAGMLDSDYDDIHAYIAKRDALDLRPVAVELFVVNDELTTAGTLDRVYIVNGDFDHPTTGERLKLRNELLVGDVKTGAVHPGKVAMQVGIYANSVVYDLATHTRSPFPVRKDIGLLVHLPQGEHRCAVYLVDLTLGLGGVSVAAQVRAWRKTGDKAIDMKSPL
jgi:hypothetical protein